MTIDPTGLEALLRQQLDHAQARDALTNQSDDVDHAERLKQEIEQAQQRVGLLAQHVHEFVRQPDLLSLLLEEQEIVLEELCVQHEELVATRAQVEVDRDYYESLFELAPDGYLVTDAQGVISRANRAAAVLLNIPEGYLVGKPLLVFVPTDSRLAFLTYLDQVQPDHSGQPHYWKMTLQPRQQQPSVSVEVAVSAVRDSVTGAIVLRWLIRDLTNQHRLEALRQALADEQDLNQLKSQLINTISHEIRTPLTVIRTSVELLKGYSYGSTDEQQTRYFSRLISAVDRIAHLLEDALTLDHSQSRQFIVNPQRFDLVQFCRQLIEVQVMSQPGQTIEFKCDRATCYAELDQTLLNQILINLLANALKYSPAQGRVELELACFADRVQFRVQDWGIGIPPDDQPLVFTSFYRAKNVSTYPGTGLGLAIVQRAVELQHGEITLTSNLGEGTTIVVTLANPIPHDSPT